MTRLTVDPVMQEKLTSSGHLTELCDEAGRTIGYFHPVGAHSGEQPITDEMRKWADEQINEEELDRRMQDPHGISTGELIKRLQAL